MSSISQVMLMMMGIFFGLISSNWLSIIFAMEWSMFCFIFITANYVSLSSSMCTIKYFFVQSIGSLMLFLAALSIINNMEGSVVYMSIIMLGFSMKLGVFPFHFWVIPVNMSLPYLPLILMNSPLKILPLGLMQSFYVSSWSSMIGSIFVIFSLGSLITGALVGQGCMSVRGMLGASSITHSGWFILAIMSWDSFKYLLVYSLSLFLLILSLNYPSQFPSWLMLYSLAGLPPFSVFLGKLMVVSGMLDSTVPAGIIVVALGSSVFSLLYYLKFAFWLYMSQKKSEFNFLGTVILFVLNMLSLLVVFM